MTTIHTTATVEQLATRVLEALERQKRSGELMDRLSVRIADDNPLKNATVEVWCYAAENQNHLTMRSDDGQVKLRVPISTVNREMLNHTVEMMQVIYAHSLVHDKAFLASVVADMLKAADGNHYAMALIKAVEDLKGSK